MAAGCGSRASQSAAPTAPAGPPSLATSLVTASGTWAVAVMGGSAASHNNFWQLFVRPAGTASWRLATPPGVASNGGLVLAGLSAGSVLAGFRPSQDLSYSPLATTRDNGAIWSPGLLDAALADVPGALAASQSSGRLLALLADGTTDLSAPGGTAWRTLATHRALAASTAGTRCGLVSLTAVAFSRSGDPLAAAVALAAALPGSSAMPTGHGTMPGGPCRPSTHTRPSPCWRSPPPAVPRWPCWKRGPGQRHACWPCGPAVAGTGSCHRRCGWTGPRRHRRPPGRTAAWRSS